MAMIDPPHPIQQELQLIQSLLDPKIADDPLQFVRFVFPWGKPGTPLENKKGPRPWQEDELNRIAQHIAENKRRVRLGKTPILYRSATASGRGVGKSALVAWLTLWLLSTRLGSTVMISANTEPQLKNVTWAELGVWHALAINSHWFDKNALSLKPAPWFVQQVKEGLKIDDGYYQAIAKLWAEENPDAFAGPHNAVAMMVIFDEASGIPKNIWTVAEGYFTDNTLHRYWFAFSNPRKNTGAFFECFHGEQRDLWHRRNIDSRTIDASQTDLAHLENIVKTYGEDSDEARIEVKGEFPRQGDKQFISREVVQQAVDRELEVDPHAALMMGVDPARFGNDSTVIRFRQGRDARSIPPVRMKGKDNMAVANECAELINSYNPDAVCIDAGNGTGIIDRLRELGYKVHEVWFGSKSDEQEWSNKRTELWAKMREWLGGGCLPKDQDLISDLVGPEYKFMGASDRIMLETKEEMKKKGLHSPDDADALACTFAIKVAHRELRTARNGINRKANRVADGMDYNIFGGE